METFEERLNVCIEALRTGRLTLAQCLDLYPEDAPRLQPLLLTVIEVSNALHVEPAPEFARQARERFRIATGERLREAFAEVQPTYGLLEGARRRFLDAARQMLPPPRTAARPLASPFWLRLPSPALAGALAVVLALFSFTGYTFATAESALPGDWNYPAKRATEQVRLALAFDDETRHDLEIAFAEERLEEIERLARRDGHVTESALHNLQRQTDRLRRSLNAVSNPGTRARLISLTERQAMVLRTVEERVDPAARDELASVQRLAEELRTEAAVTVTEPTPVPTSVPGTASAPTQTPEAVPTEAPSAIPDETPGPPAPTPTPRPRPAPVAGFVVRGPTDDTTAGLSWEWLVTERFAFLVPTFESGWVLGDPSFQNGDRAPVPPVIRLTRVDGRSIVAIFPGTADVTWYHYDGSWHEFNLRVTTSDGVAVADLGLIERLYPDAGPVVAHIVRSIELVPEPAPTATPTPAETPAASSAQ
jgi:hypothetical protein